MACVDSTALDCVHDGTDIFHSAFEGELLLPVEDVIGQAHASAVEQDQPAE